MRSLFASSFGRLWFTIWEVDDTIHNRLTTGVATSHYYENRSLLPGYGSFHRYLSITVDVDGLGPHPKHRGRFRKLYFSQRNCIPRKLHSFSLHCIKPCKAYLHDIPFSKVRKTWISIWFKWLLNRMIITVIYKSEHETLQLCCLNDKPNNRMVVTNQFQWIAIAKPRGNQIGAIGDREQRPEDTALSCKAQ